MRDSGSHAKTPSTCQDARDCSERDVQRSRRNRLKRGEKATDQGAWQCRSLPPSNSALSSIKSSSAPLSPSLASFPTSNDHLCCHRTCFSLHALRLQEAARLCTSSCLYPTCTRFCWDPFARESISLSSLSPPNPIFRQDISWLPSHDGRQRDAANCRASRAGCNTTTGSATTAVAAGLLGRQQHHRQPHLPVARMRRTLRLCRGALRPCLRAPCRP